MKLEILDKDHIGQILALEKYSAPDKPYYSRYDLEALNFLFDNSKSSGAVGVFDSGKLIAWGAYRTNWKRHTKEKGTCEISSIVVDKTRRRQGIGKLILNHLIELLREKGNLTKIFLTVSPLNTEALSLYIKQGFIVYDYRKDVYGSGSDRVYLELVFNS